VLSHLDQFQFKKLVTREQIKMGDKLADALNRMLKTHSYNDAPFLVKSLA